MGTQSKQLERVLFISGILLLAAITVIQLTRSHPQRLIPQLSESQQASAVPTPLLTGGLDTDGNAASPHFYVLDAHRENEGQYSQFVRTLTYAKLPMTVLDDEGLEQLKPSPYHVLITASEDLTDRQLGRIEQFVREGGSLYVGKRFNRDAFNELSGIRDNKGFTKISVHGIETVQPMHSIYDKLPDVHDIVNNSMRVQVADTAELYLESEGMPLFWTNTYGKGNVGYFNGTWLSSKSARGLFLQTLELVPPRYSAALTGVEVVFIDDFPAPFPETWGTAQQAYADYYGMSPAAFLQTVWWRDMKTIAARENVLYTAVMIGTYEDRLSGDGRKLAEKNRKELAYYTRDAYQRGYEVGLHGYNHQPLLLPEEEVDDSLGYTPWADTGDMKTGLGHMQHLLHEYYPDAEFLTYVPPSNVLDGTGLRVLTDTLPHLRTISSVYDGQVKGSYVQELGPDDSNPELFHLPRFSSGFHVDESNMLGAYDAAGHLGMVSHFIHPDDLISDRSNGYMWEQLKKDFAGYLSDMKAAYPVLTPYTASQASEYLKGYLTGRVHIRHTEDSIIVSADRMPVPLRLAVRLNSGERLDASAADGTIVYPIGDGTGLYQLEIHKVPAVLPVVKGEEPS